MANQALTRKLAALFWRLLVYGQHYVEEGLKRYEAKVADTQRQWLHKLAKNTVCCSRQNRPDLPRFMGN